MIRPAIVYAKDQNKVTTVKAEQVASLDERLEHGQGREEEDAEVVENKEPECFEDVEYFRSLDPIDSVKLGKESVNFLRKYSIL